MKRFDIVGIESACMDLALNIDHMPAENYGAKLLDFSFQGGGKIATGLVAAARLGAKCAIMGACGDDIFARACLADFDAHGVDRSRMVCRSEMRSSFSVVLSDPAGRSILYRPMPDALREDEVDYSVVSDTRFFFLAHFNPITLQCCEIAHSSKATTLMDADTYKPEEELERNLRSVDVLIASEFIYKALFSNKNYEANCALTRALGPRVVIFTLGERGLVGMDENGFFALPAFQVPVFDTLGAGDVFHGAFLAALCDGANDQEAACFASAAAAIKCTRPGGRAGIPDKKTILRFLETGEIDFSELDARRERYRRGLEL